jgi:phage terminase small subunit
MGVKRITAKDITGLSHDHANFVIEYVKDFAPRRAAEASGFSPDYAHKLLERPDITAVVNHILQQRLEAAHIDAEWVLMEAVDNHQIARQRGNLAASNTALNLVAKHVFVDAFAAEKVEVSTDKDVMERLLRARQRMKLPNPATPEETPPVEGVSFL